jgi:hypothetical protein
MQCRLMFASLGIVLAAAAAAPASFVHSILPSDGIGTNANLLSDDFTDKVGQDPGPFLNEDYTGPASGNTNFVNMEFDVLQQGGPFNVEIRRHGGPTQAAEYWFEVTLNNLTGAAIEEVTIGLFNNPNGPTPAVLARHDVGSNPTPVGGTYTRISDSLARFSGIGLAPGATAVLGFSVDLLADFVIPFGDQNRPFFVQFTATPEPQSILLGGLCLLSVIGLVLRRRRVATAA